MPSADEKFMLMALKQAALSLKERELPVGAVVVYKNRVLGRGRKFINGSVRLDHAEVAALREAFKNSDLADEMTIYTTLEPCMMCFGTILNSRIARVVYAMEDPYGGGCNLDPSSLPIRHQVRFPYIEKGICRDESRKLLNIFFKKTNIKFWKDKSNPLIRLCL